MEDGKILVCTEGMFNVYNGNSFEPLACDLTYTVPLGMHNLCTSYDGGNGLLWAKDFYRLYLINTRTGRFCHDIKERFEAARLTEAFNDFILDHDRNAWIITESGKLYRYDWKKPAKQVYEPRPEEKSRGIRVKEVMQAGPFHLIFLNTGRMLVWEEKSGRIVGEDSTVATPAPSEYFRTAWLQADKEHLLISVSHTEGYLYLYNIYTREWKEILKGKAINDIKKCKDGCFWLGGNQTLIKLSPRFELLQETHRLELTGNESVTDFIMSVLIDDRQGLWLGLSSSGILRAVPPGKYMEYYINEEVAHEEGRMIRSLCPYDGRHLLVARWKASTCSTRPAKTTGHSTPDSVTSIVQTSKETRTVHSGAAPGKDYTKYRATGSSGQTRRCCRASRPKRSVSAFPFPMAASWFVWI